MKTYLREAWRSLASNKQRSLLALLGIVIGIASVIALVSLGNIFSAEATRKFRELGTNIARIGLQSADRDDDALRSSRFARRLADTLPCVETAVPMAQLYGGGMDGPVQISTLAATAGLRDLARARMAEGRFLNDLDAQSRFIVLGAAAARAMRERLGVEDLVGQEIVLAGRPHLIIGVLAPSSSLTVMNVELDGAQIVHADRWTADAATNSLNSILVRIRSDSDLAACTQAIRTFVARRNPAMRMDIRTADQLITTMQEQTALIQILLAAIGSISLVVGGVGIMNIMLVSVSERRQEIGVRRALGARQADIRYQFLSEALMLSTVGGLIGAAIGAATTYAVALANGWEFFLLPGPFALGIGVSVLIGMLFGYWPAHLASVQDPIAALRSD